jgi:integrase
MKFTRTHYQFGSLERKKRKDGPDAWAYRYRQLQPDGSVRHKSKVIGTVEQYPTESQAWKAAEVFRLSANPDNPAQHGVSWGALVDRYVADEMPRRKSSRRGYLIFLNNFIKPKWGEYAIAKVSSFAVEEWLKNLTRSNDSRRPLAPKSKVAIRSLMHILYQCALRWGLVPLQVNPFGKRLIRIKDAGKKLTEAHVLTVEQFHRLLEHRLMNKEPFRTMAHLAMCLGLRCNELFALRWSDIDHQTSALNIKRGVVRGIIDDPKTPSSEASLPLATELADLLTKWKRRSPFTAASDFIFASPRRGGRSPYEPHGIQQNRLRVAGLETGLGDGIGWHTFRHTYCSLLDDLGAPLRVQQKLMRHADARMTLKYGKAFSQSEYKANQKVVDLVLTEATG